MKKVLSLVIILVLSMSIGKLCSIPVEATVYSYGNFTYQISDGSEVEILTYSGPADVVFPATISGKPVTKIKDYMFKSSFRRYTLKSLTIPSTIKNIGEGNCTGAECLEKITVDSNNQYYKSINGVLFNKSGKTILAYPLASKNTSYSIPSGVETISSTVFYLSKNLINITIPSSVRTINKYAFYYCEGVQNITIAKGVTEIQEGAFRCCTELKSITIPDSVKSFGLMAFADCFKLDKLTIPSSVTTIENEAFSNTPVTLYVKENSAAHKFAIKENVKFVLVKNPTPTTTPVTTTKPSGTTGKTDTTASDTTTSAAITTTSKTDENTSTTQSISDSDILSPSSSEAVIDSQGNSEIEASNNNSVSDNDKFNMFPIIIISIAVLACVAIVVLKIRKKKNK